MAAEKHYDEVSKSHYYIIWTSRKKLLQATSKYYETHKWYHPENPLSIDSDAREPISDMVKRLNSRVCINGSPYSTDGSVRMNGIWGVHIVDGVIKNEGGNGWNTIAIDNSGRFVYLKPHYTATQIRDWGYQNAFEVMTPLVIDGKEVPEDVKVKYGREGWYDVKSPRSAIAQTKDGSLVFIVTNGRDIPKGEPGFTYERLSQICMNLNLQNAFACDGGGSSELWDRTTKVNPDIDTPRRKCPHVLYVV